MSTTDMLRSVATTHHHLDAALQAPTMKSALTTAPRGGRGGGSTPRLRATSTLARKLGIVPANHHNDGILRSSQQRACAAVQATGACYGSTDHACSNTSARIGTFLAATSCCSIAHGALRTFDILGRPSNVIPIPIAFIQHHDPVTVSYGPCPKWMISPSQTSPLSATRLQASRVSKPAISLLGISSGKQTPQFMKLRRSSSMHNPISYIPLQ